MNIIEKPSPNFEERSAPVDMLVLHYTGMKSAEAALQKLRDPNAANRVSVHYMVDEDGTVMRLVPEEKRAWHAGVSEWRGHRNINDRSIGIEIVNPGHEFGYRPFTPQQMQAVAELGKDIVTRHNIPSWNVVAHSDVAPGRKEDPGELFDWGQLAQHGVGIVPKQEPPAPGALQDPVGWVKRLFKESLRRTPIAGISSVLDMQIKLRKFGYNCPLCGTVGDDTRAAITAFQRHFRQEKVNGEWDEQCETRLNDLLTRVPAATVAEPDGRVAAPAR